MFIKPKIRKLVIGDGKMKTNEEKMDEELTKLYALFKKIVALGYLIQQKYHNDIRNMLP